MKKKILFIGFLLVLNYTNSQNKFIQIGASGHDGINDLVIDKSQNLYIAGYFQGDFQNIKAKGDSDAFTAKLNADNEIIWLNSFGSNYKNKQEITEYAKFIKIDENGNSYVSGLFYADIIANNTKITSSGKQDAFVVKYDTNGNQLWVKTFGTINNENVKGLFLRDNHIYLIVEFGIEGKYTSNRNLILKLDLNGNELWRKEVYHNNLLDFKIIEIKQDFNNFYFLIEKNNNKHIIRLNSETAHIDNKFTQTNHKIVSFDLRDNNLFILEKDETNLAISKKGLNNKLIWSKNYNESDNNLNPTKINVDFDKIIIVGNYSNFESKGSIIYEINSDGTIVKPHYFSSDYQNKIIKYHISEDDLFLVGQFYNSIDVDNMVLQSEGRTDSFIEIKKSLFQTSNLNVVDLWIYPNPNNGEFYIKNPADIKSVKVYDLSGKLIYKRNLLIEPTDKIKLFNISSGVYSVEIYKTNGKRTTGKIIINK